MEPPAPPPGPADSPLTPKGRSQAKQAALALRAAPVDAILTSPLGRAQATAHLIAEVLQLDVIVVDTLLEVDHGQWAGLTNDDIDVRAPGELARREGDKYNWRFPSGESYRDTYARAAVAIETVDATGASVPVLVTHEMVARMLLAQLVGMTTSEALAQRLSPGQTITVNRDTRTLGRLE